MNDKISQRQFVPGKVFLARQDVVINSKNCIKVLFSLCDKLEKEVKTQSFDVTLENFACDLPNQAKCAQVG